MIPKRSFTERGTSLRMPIRLQKQSTHPVTFGVTILILQQVPALAPASVGKIELIKYETLGVE